MLTVLKETDFLDFKNGDTYICKEPWRYHRRPKHNQIYRLGQVRSMMEGTDDLDEIDWFSTNKFELGYDLKRYGWYNYYQLSADVGFEETFELSDGTRVVAFGYVEGI